jgi:HEAT repeat protein
MGLVKGKPTTSTGKPERANCEELKASLDNPDASIRRHSAQKVLHCPDAVKALATRLKREKDVAVREAILASMGQINNSEVVEELVECLRSDDAALCNEAIETLKLLTTDVSSALKSLLADPDPDLRIFAVNIIESRCDPDVERMLIGVIERDINVNVCATAVDLLCEVGTEAAFDPILQLKGRFASEAYIQFAADLALKRIREI